MKAKYRCGWSRTALVTAAIVAQPSIAHAQQSPTALDDIVVTARKFAERLQDAPVTVTTVSGEMLDKKGIRDLESVAQMTPSLTFLGDADGRASAMIRGVGESTDVAISPGVAMFVDGIYQPSPAFFSIPFFDIARIEVLKGPQGTLYGKNTLGGAIAVYTRDPEPDFGGKASIAYSTGNTIDASAAINIPLTDTLRNRTTVLYRKSDGLFDNSFLNVDADPRRDVAFRTRFVFEPSSNFESSFFVFLRRSEERAVYLFGHEERWQQIRREHRNKFARR